MVKISFKVSDTRDTGHGTCRSRVEQVVDALDHFVFPCAILICYRPNAVCHSMTKMLLIILVFYQA